MIEENKESDVQNIEEKEEDKKRSNILINILIIFVIIVVSILMYAKYVGTKGIVVKEYLLQSEFIPDNFSGVKIIYISDLLYGSTVSLKDVEELIDKVNERKPDIVLFGGGMILEDYKISKKDKNSLIEAFDNIDATLGKYAVKGSTDNEEYNELLTNMGFIVLNNEYDLIYRENKEPICLSGIGSYNLGEYDLVKAFSFFDTNPNCFTIAFTHEPDILDKISSLEHRPNVIFSGNSLGGEVNIPFYGPILKFEGSNKYFLDYYDKDNIKLYVSSGIGTKRYNMRLFNKPSFNFYRLKS